MDFLSFVVRELLTFEFVAPNQSPPGPLIKKFCLVRVGLNIVGYIFRMIGLALKKAV